MAAIEFAKETAAHVKFHGIGTTFPIGRKKNCAYGEKHKCGSTVDINTPIIDNDNERAANFNNNKIQTMLVIEGSTWPLLEAREIIDKVIIVQITMIPVHVMYNRFDI